eukprot:6188275-Pleurochrysis_carterae.AAC.1
MHECGERRSADKIRVIGIACVAVIVLGWTEWPESNACNRVVKHRNFDAVSEIQNLSHGGGVRALYRVPHALSAPNWRRGPGVAVDVVL